MPVPFFVTVLKQKPSNLLGQDRKGERSTSSEPHSTLVPIGAGRLRQPANTPKPDPGPASVFLTTQRIIYTRHKRPKIPLKIHRIAKKQIHAMVYIILVISPFHQKHSTDAHRVNRNKIAGNLFVAGSWFYTAFHAY